MDRLGTESAFEVLARAREMEEEGRTVIHLEIGEPDFETPAHVAEAGVRAIRDGLTHYAPAAGIPELREAAAAFFARTRGVEVPAGRIVVTPGAKPIMFYAIMATCGPGDEVVYPDPGFPMFESITAFAGATPVPVPLREENGFRVDPDELGSLVGDRTRMVILNTPHNPCGSALGPGEVERIAQVVAGRDLYVLTDEMYWAIRYGGQHLSIAAIEGLADRTILLDGCSKTFAMTGWRLGFAALPEPLVEPVTRLVINSVSCTATFVQAAAVAALEGPMDEVDRMVEELHARRSVIVEGLNAIEGIACAQPDGAFYAFPNVGSLGGTSRRLASHLLEAAGVACLWGTAFGRYGEGHLRISYANSVENIRAALAAIQDALPSYRPA
jgi:aspartate/methionine/tyrosine aminotransferase